MQFVCKMPGWTKFNTLTVLPQANSRFSSEFAVSHAKAAPAGTGKSREFRHLKGSKQDHWKPEGTFLHLKKNTVCACGNWGPFSAGSFLPVQSWSVLPQKQRWKSGWWLWTQHVPTRSVSFCLAWNHADRAILSRECLSMKANAALDLFPLWNSCPTSWKGQLLHAEVHREVRWRHLHAEAFVHLQTLPVQGWFPKLKFSTWSSDEIRNPLQSIAILILHMLLHSSHTWMSLCKGWYSSTPGSTKSPPPL